MKLFKITVLILFLTILASCSNDDELQVDEQESTISSQADEIVTLNENFDQLRENEELVKDFYQEFFGDLKFDEAGNKYIGDVYVQHNPNLGDGRQELIDKAKIWFAGKEPFTVDIRRVFASGDYVFIHTKGSAGKNGTSVMDVFKIENNKLVEHWDTMQSIPDEAENDHPFFREL